MKLLSGICLFAALCQSAAVFAAPPVLLSEAIASGESIGLGRALDAVRGLRPIAAQMRGLSEMAKSVDEESPALASELRTMRAVLSELSGIAEDEGNTAAGAFWAAWTFALLRNFPAYALPASFTVRLEGILASAPGVAEGALVAAAPVAVVGGMAYLTYEGVIKPIKEGAINHGLVSAGQSIPGSFAARVISEQAEAEGDRRLAMALTMGREMYGSGYELPEYYIESVRADAWADTIRALSARAE